MKKDTSWEEVAGWYDTLLETDEDSYQRKVILPNLSRMMDIHPDEVVLDNACGQGFFTREWHRLGAQVFGADLSPLLIKYAKEHSSKDISLFTTSADKLPHIVTKSVDKISIVLAIQNIEHIAAVFAECKRVLKPTGKLILVLNHPTFRIPKASSWNFDEAANTQYRRVDAYMSESRITIDMNPGSPKKKTTVSFHRPLQVYIKSLNKAGLAVTRLEEWISHKKSQKGPRSDAEDKARKEIPLFMAIEAAPH
jgi:ubiquinone/menaquinone biosynthesis C-methylase UbiE